MSRGFGWSAALAAAGMVFGSAGTGFAADAVVVQKNRAFSVAEVAVKRGESVIFKNEDTVTHNVFSPTPGAEFDVRAQQPGASSAVKFDRPGIVEVMCAIHPQMKMTVKVQAP